MRALPNSNSYGMSLKRSQALDFTSLKGSYLPKFDSSVKRCLQSVMPVL
jgi:hypothetical protein